MEELGVTRPLLDEQLVALADVERRRLLLSLMEETSRTIDSVEGSDPTMRAERRDRLIELHHRHLPKLEANGFIRWDREEQVVARGAQFEEIRPLLELLDARRDELPPGWV